MEKQEKQWSKGDKVTPIQGVRKGVIGVVRAGNSVNSIFGGSTYVTVDLDGVGWRPFKANNLKRV
tara:strand:+ start:268 stop:462 length:195 start_codon:yes stop_codon:yes gene_type:complete